MKINSAFFVKGIKGTNDILSDGRYQVAFLGRSNVGKSTLINSLVSKKSLARTSANPGKTVRMDFFLINNKFYFVDFPGYGYAKVSSQFHDKLRKMILWYLQYSLVKPRMIVVILDSKVGMTEFDKEVTDILIEQKEKFILVANKFDKLKENQKEEQMKKIQENCPNIQVIPHSIITMKGKDEILRAIESEIK